MFHGIKVRNVISALNTNDEDLIDHLNDYETLDLFVSDNVGFDQLTQILKNLINKQEEGDRPCLNVTTARMEDVSDEYEIIQTMISQFKCRCS